MNVAKSSPTPLKKKPRVDHCTNTNDLRVLASKSNPASSPGATDRMGSEFRAVANTRNPGSDMARGEGVKTRQGLQRELDWQAWQSEMVPENCSHSTVRPPCIHKDSVPTYRTVLAKRGLLAKDTLGAGSYSKVKLAHYLRHDDQVYPEQVAVKIIDRTKAPRDFQEKFLPRELEVWPRLKHSNIVQMLDFFQENYRVYMILEFCEGGDALRYIQSSGALPESSARTWVYQVGDAVRYLHEMNITHRDLKLENMLIDKYNNVKLCDFGFVKPCCAEELSKTFCGSKSYAAPEILKGEPYEAKKADIWALGVILFILVTGRMPYDETKGNASLLEEHKKLDLQWPKGKRTVTSQCKALTLYCFQFNWPERPTIHQIMAHNWFRMSLPASK